MHGEKKVEGHKKDGGIFCMCCREVVSPSQFEAHAECVGLSAIPRGIWYCKYCQNMFEKETFAEPDANAIAARRVPGIDPLEAIGQWCILVVGTLEPEIGGCAICRHHDFCKSRFTGRTIIICDQCEKEYHIGYLKEQNIVDLKRLLEARSDVLKMKCKGQSLQNNPELGIRWRLLVAKRPQKTLGRGFLDRFDPIVDASTSRRDLIPHMVYGRHFKDQDFCGMYCAVLMVNTVVVSAAIFRIFREEVAELPLVATRSECQGKGYFQSLLYCIEGLLASLNVKDLVLPAANEAESMWRNRLGFEKLGQEQ
ncbi:UNVERIFIED_CONTAM: hypothetical protein Slati_3432400, partial [Sesamum latifolium]